MVEDISIHLFLNRKTRAMKRCVQPFLINGLAFMQIIFFYGEKASSQECPVR